MGPDGPQVSAICLGSAYFGTRIDRETCFEILDTYYEAGGRFIDTANNYAGWLPGARGGESERVIGDWLRARGVRQEMFIATKVGFPYPGVAQGTSPEQIAAESEKSLRNLGIEAIDLYYLHLDDRQTPLVDRLQALNALVRSGKVRFLGASNFRAWRMEEVRQISLSRHLPGLVALENHHTYLQPRPEADWSPGVVMGNEHRDFARTYGVRLVAYYALMKGAYVRPDRPVWASYRTAANEERLSRVRQAAEETGASPNQVVLAWMLYSDPPILPITTASHTSHLLENLGALSVTLSSEQMDFLNFAELTTK